MKSGLFRSCRLGIAAVTLIAGTAALTTYVNDSNAQDATGQSGQSGHADQAGEAGNAEMQQMMEMMAKYGAPGSEHKQLEDMVGSWTSTMTHWTAPGAPPEVSKGTVNYEMILEGRYLIGHHKSDFGGMPFEGIEIIGYDRFRQRMYSIWIDNMSTSYMVQHSEEGVSDLSNMNMRGKYDDYMTGRRDVRVKSMSSSMNDDKTKFEMHFENPDGTMSKAVEVVCERVKTTSGAGAPSGSGAGR